MFARAATGARGVLRRFRDRWPWLDHLVHAGGHYNRVQGDLLAAGVTYYVFLALFPVLLLAASVAGYVLSGNPLLEQRLAQGIEDAVPGDTGQRLAEQVDAAIDSRGVVGVLGLLGFLFIGLGAVDKLRVGMDVVWRGRPDPADFFRDRVRDLGALLGLGVAGGISVGLTTTATAASSRLLEWLGLDLVPGFFLLTAGIAILLALLGDTLVFLWLLKGVPDNPFGLRLLLPGAVFGAVGFELLKLVGNAYLTIIGDNVTAQTLGGIVGLIVWINVVARFAFYTASWTATIPAIERVRAPAEPAPGPEPDAPAAAGEPRSPTSPVRLVLGLLGAGMVTGAVAGRLLARSAGRGGPPVGAPPESR